MHLLLFLDESNFVAKAETVFEEKRAADAFELTSDHDTDSVTQHVCLIHIVRSKDNNSVFFKRFKHVPQVTARA